jgi:hypothetical protein
MVCEEKHRLVVEYAATAKSLSKAVAKLRGLTGIEFKEVLAGSEAARVECAKARKALFRHKAEHGC